MLIKVFKLVQACFIVCPPIGSRFNRPLVGKSALCIPILAKYSHSGIDDIPTSSTTSSKELAYSKLIFSVLTATGDIILSPLARKL